VTDIAVICTECQGLISDHAGFLALTFAEEPDEYELRMWDVDRAQDREIHIDVAVSPLAERGAWHIACSPESQSQGWYTIEVHLIRTWPRVVDWTAQMMSLGWLNETDWADVLRALLESSDSRSVGVLASTLPKAALDT